MTENDARKLLESGLTHADADSLLLTLNGAREASTRFANNAITQNVARTDTVLTVKAAYGHQVGVAKVNTLTADAIRDAVERAEDIARHAAPDTEHMPLVEPCRVPEVAAWDESVAEASPGLRAEAIRQAIERVEAQGLTAAGSFATEAGFTALLNSRGHFAYHRETDARFVCTAIGPDSSGWASTSSFKLDAVDAGSVADRAAERAVASAHPEAIEPGPTTVILEPAAVGELLAYLAWSLDAKAADEGRSAFTGKLGARIGVPGVTLSSQPDHPVCPARPFDGDGMPAPTVDWIRDGELANLAHTRYWAKQAGRSYTGMPANLIMTGTQTPVSQLIADTSDGVLVTRFWYIRFVDPMKLLLTGMTRDGLLRIKDGKIVGGLRNMRFNESPLRVLANIAVIGAAEPVAGYGRGLMPALKVESFAFSSSTAF